jgi:hypothetical protein
LALAQAAPAEVIEDVVAPKTTPLRRLGRKLVTDGLRAFESRGASFQRADGSFDVKAAAAAATEAILREVKSARAEYRAILGEERGSQAEGATEAGVRQGAAEAGETFLAHAPADLGDAKRAFKRHLAAFIRFAHARIDDAVAKALQWLEARATGAAR